MAPWLRYLIAFVVGAHRFTYLPFGLLVPRKEKRWQSHSWLLGDTVTGTGLNVLVPTLHLLAGITILASAVAVAIAIAPSAPQRWRPLAIAGGTLGLAAIASFWDGQTQLIAVRRRHRCHRQLDSGRDRDRNSGSIPLTHTAPDAPGPR